jgi:DegV family protein with EDD domain
MAVKIVTDSTCDIPAELAEEYGITVVPVTVRFGTTSFLDGVELTTDELYERLTSGGDLPTTSQPSIGEFLEVYERVGQDADGIVSIHVSAKLSGTYNSAMQASDQAEGDCPIDVVDTEQASMGIGLTVLAAAKAANEGANMDEVGALVDSAVQRSNCMALLGTLEFLQKGGRIGKAQALVGTLLRIHPMIVLSEGEVLPLARPRTRRKGLQELKKACMQLGTLEALSIIHSTVPDEAVNLAAELSSVLPDGVEPIVARFGPALGTYVGPKAIGLASITAPGNA